MDTIKKAINKQIYKRYEKKSYVCCSLGCSNNGVLQWQEHRTERSEHRFDLAAVAGTYEGTLPAADCPGIKTVLTINADSTYQLKQDYIDRKDGHDEASGVLEVLDNNVLMLVRPSSGEHTFYKVKDNSSVIMTDSLGNEPEGEMAKLYVLTKK